MKKTIFTALSATILFSGTLNAQQTRNCGTMDNLERLKAEHPEIESRLQKIEQQTQQWIAAGGESSRAATVYRIPVVVHVLYNTSSQNISDAQIQSQITVLNNDFRRLNADKSNTPSTFSSVAADAEIEFCLASVDPNGNSTTGIIRKSTSSTLFTDNDNVKYDSYGGSTAWPSNKYLNLWVCNLGSSLLGYAQFPGGPSATDGVVINYKYFGTTGTATAPFNKGRTATHEVGHWLNLYHIWGDATCGNDGVSDTPVQYGDNYGCPSHPKSNSCGTSAEMFMNYMDYTDDACMNMFSTGQKTRMRALFASGGARSGLLTSTGCGSSTSTPTPSYCAAASSNTGYEWISNVKLGSINNTSGASGGYADYTAISTSLTKGSSATISLTPSFASSSYTEYFRVYIDYNQDKDFEDSGELVYTSAGSATAVSGSFTVPSTALTGTTRMRVMMKDGSITGPCESFTYGEVEDYSVNITSTTTTTPSSSILTLGSGTSSTSNLPYASYYTDERAQFIITKAELTAAGYNGVNNKIKSLAFNVKTASTQVMNNFTIKIKHTSSAYYSNTYFISNSGATTCYVANYKTLTGWNTHTFSTPFIYNGTDNLLVEICWDNSSSSSSSSVYYTSTSNYQTLYKRSTLSSGGLCTTTSGSRTTARPNMKFEFAPNTGKEINTEENKENHSGENESTISFSSNAKILNIYPNPASSVLNFNYSVTEESSPVKLNIYSITGSLVISKDLGIKENGEHGESLDLNSESVSPLPNGNYIFVLNINGMPETKRFVLIK